jgi:hypothetical protein
VWLKVNYLIAIAVAMAGWLFLIVWIARQLI